MQARVTGAPIWLEERNAFVEQCMTCLSLSLGRDGLHVNGFCFNLCSPAHRVPDIFNYMQTEVGYVLFSYLNIHPHPLHAQPATTRHLCHPLSAGPEDLLLIKPANQRESEWGREQRMKRFLHLPEIDLQQCLLYGNRVSHIFILEAVAKDRSS